MDVPSALLLIASIVLVALGAMAESRHAYPANHPWEHHS